MLGDPNMKQIPFSLSESEFKRMISNTDFTSVIGHEDLAIALSEITGQEIPFNRKAIELTYDDFVLLVSLKGRLPEHPTLVEYQGKLKYAFIRFERQTITDFDNTMFKIKEISGAI
jgi:hypothetical protein